MILRFEGFKDNRHIGLQLGQNIRIHREAVEADLARLLRLIQSTEQQSFHLIIQRKGRQ
ncbi:hypothetical protein D3C80_2040320 [compost metagenome]